MGTRLKGPQTKNIPRLLSAKPLPVWAILPLRLFLAISFISAGWDKLTDPSYLNPSARDYIGNQIPRMATGSPIQGFLNGVAAPNATLFGVLVMGGELLIGLAVLFGALTRFSAIMGMMLNLTFFLSATWDIHPFYFGADLPYVFLWLTLLLAGPGPLAVDALVERWLEEGTPAPAPPPVPMKNAGARRAAGMQARPQVRSPRYETPAPESPPALTRRTFLGIGSAGLTFAGLLATGLGWDLLHPGNGSARSVGSASRSATATPEGPAPGQVPTLPGTGTPTPQAAPPTDTVSPQAGAPPTATPSTSQAPPAPSDTPAAASNPTGRQLLAAPGALPKGQVLTFQLPAGDPAVLVHNDAGYSAFVAICTHRGCQVQPIQTGYLGCPCHGAVFDTNQGGVPVQGPARRALDTVPVVVGSDGSVYLGG
jgi:thiosulfate dehydrogenase [quinone] large subunit